MTMSQKYRPIDSGDFESRIRELEADMTTLDNRISVVEGLIEDLIGVQFARVSARQWQSALAFQGKLEDVRIMIPADLNNSVNIQWFTSGIIRQPPEDDPVWEFTKTTLSYTDAQMTALNDLARTMDS